MIQQELHITVRVIVICAAILLGIHFWPSTKTVDHTPNGTPNQGSQVQQEVAAVTAALKLTAALSGKAPIYQQPAINVIRETVPGISHLSDAQLGAILGALKPKTVPVVHVASHLSSATPQPLPSSVPGLTDAEIAAINAADIAAVRTVLSDPSTKIATTVSITQEEVPVSRIGSIIDSDGSAGLAYAFERKGRFEVNIGAVQSGKHLVPIFQPAFMIPHTQLSIGPAVTFNKHIGIGVAATIHF